MIFYVILFITFKVKTKGQNEGEVLLVPKLRFKEFKKEYNTYKLKDIVEFYKGNTLSKSDIKTKRKISLYFIWRIIYKI